MYSTVEAGMNNTRFSKAASKAGGVVESVNVVNERFSHSSHSAIEVSYTFRFYLNDSILNLDDFERTVLQQDELEEMKRIIEDNPELKTMYSTYKALDVLEGKSK